MADKIQIRRDTAANWATQNPVLSQGELGAETDTSKIKMGDASSTWNQLGYLIDTGSYATSSQLQTAVSDLVDSAPGALDTLNELAAALGDDPDFATTVTNAIATKATTSTLSAVATSGDYTDLSNRPTIPTALTDVGVTDGSNGQVLSTDGSGTFTFVDSYDDADVSSYLANNGYGTSSSIVASIVDSAPGALDTLNELASALGDDANFSTTVTNSLALKANTADLNAVATSGAYTDLSGTPTIPSDLTDVGITDGTIGQVLTTNGSGTFTFADAAAGGGGGGSFEAVASGALANGDKVLVNADGTVSVVAGDAAPTGPGSETSFSTGGMSSSHMSISHDPVSGKIVIFHRDQNNSGYATALLGTVSGDSITFGSPIVIKSAAANYYKTEIDPSTGKIIFMYSLQSTGAVEYVVGSVSGSGISLGSHTAVPFNAQAHTWDIAYDTTSSKMVMTYNNNDPQYHVMGVVITISGTSLSFGSSASIWTENYGFDAQLVSDPDSGKVIIVFTAKDSSNNTLPRAAALTVSGTSLSVGSVTTIFSSYVALVNAYYDTKANKLGVVYRDESGPNTVNIKVGTVSGNSISFGSATVIASSTTTSFNPVTAAFDTSAGKAVVSYRYEDGNTLSASTVTISGTTATSTSAPDVSNSVSRAKSTFDSTQKRIVYLIVDGSNNGSSVTYNSVGGTTSTNLTAENYVGISDAAYADGATATIQSAGAVDDAQSGLTPGQAYYLQYNGTLDTTAGDPSVFAGTALSATQLMIGKSPEIVSYSDSDVASYLSSNDYATSTATIAAITDSAPATLDTLNELAAALGDDANFSTTVTNSIALKANSADLNTVATSGAYADLSGTPSLSAVATSGAYADISGTPSVPSALTDIGITDGTNGQVLTTNGSGAFTFADAASPYGDSNVASYLASAVIDGGSA